MAREGQVIRRGERKFLIRWYNGTDSTGKRRYASKTIRGTKKDAEAALREVHRQRDAGITVDSKGLRVNEYLDRWLAEAAPKARKEHTVRSYRDNFRLHVRPAIGEKHLDRLTVLDVQAVVNSLEEKGMAPQSIRLVHAALSAALSQAVRWRMIPFNPCRDVEMPKRNPKEMMCLTPEEWGRLRGAMRGAKHEVFFLFLASTGLRPSEAYGLLRENLDLEKGEIRVEKKLDRLKGGGWARGPLKTKRSRRTITLPPSLLQALRAHDVNQKAEQLRLGSAYARHGFVFANDLGEPLDHRNVVQRHFKPLLKAAGIDERFRLYDLRHTAASFMLMQSGDARAVADRLGHSSAKMTLDVYAHTLPAQRDTLTARMERALFGDS